MFRKLKSIIVISYLAVTVLFFSSFSIITYKIFFDYTREEISEARLTGINESMSRISSFTTSVRDSGIYFVTNRNVIQTFSHQNVSTYESIVEQRTLTDLMNDIASFKRGIHSIELYTDRYNHYPNVAGSRVYSTQLIEEEPWFEFINKSNYGWIPKHESPSTKEFVVSYYHHVTNPRGITVGYVKVNVLADTFLESMYERNFADNIDEPLLLFDSNRRIIGHTNTSESHEVINQLITYESNGEYGMLSEEYVNQFNQYDILEEKDNKYMLVISKANEDQWRLVHLVPIDSLYSESRKLGVIVFFLGITSLLLLIPISYFVGRSLLQPINKIIQGMQEVEKGNFDVRVKPHYIDEYKTMANNFNRMTFQLDQSLKDLKRENRLKREAELRTLQNQIVPHFLYNTLDMIHWKAMDYQAEDISFMVNQLSKMYRIGVSGGQSFIPLRDELEHVKCYINLQKVRMHADIKYDVRIPATIKEAFVPKVILQPFVENSIKHGFLRDIENPIHIRILATCSEDYLEIKIIDNGTGLPNGWKIEDSKGIGIKNIKERIWIYCGTNYGVDLFNGDDGGTIVYMKLPMIKNREQLKNFLNED
ncbi:sensor histidine kinase [Evansella sp. AB-rgal1]|uniref:cache domain-containing sensor histidine kinase n=1 Tax=Evansella sp. AB-rgal1 TaxID=3242696 RepID=UPI00359D1734